MSSIFAFILLPLWFVSAIIDNLEFCYLWQLKEYRVDRMRDFLRTIQGKRYWLKYNLLWRSLFALVLLFWPINVRDVVQLFLLGIFSADIFRSLYLLVGKKLRRPVPTAKAVLVVAIALGLEGAIIIWSRDWTIFFILMISRFFLVSTVVGILRVPTIILKGWCIRRAERKLKQYPKLRVIGITGSFGKTTVKTFLAHILGGRYRVVMTPNNTNTDIGVAKFIAKTDWQGVEVFLVEMGAYKRGEIKATADMVHPTVGILTAINEQHIALFGNIEETQATKYELLRSLPKNGLAVTNSDNAYCREFLHELTTTVKTFGCDEVYHPELHVTACTTKTGGITCSFACSGETFTIETTVIGPHNCMNLAPCLIVGEYLGMKRAEMIDRARTLSLPPQTLHVSSYGTCTIVDDSYNANPDGFTAALQVLTSYPSHRKRVVITRGMLELGVESHELHEKIGGEIAFVADELIVISRDFEKPLRTGVGTKYQTTILVKDNPEELLAYIQSLKQTNAVILLENRMPEMIYREVIGYA